jgi:3-hydroxyacyl-[acyl-carrier-protein] dehydratase
MQHETVFGIEEILKLLPHRPPFLFVDRIIAFKPGISITAEREIKADEFYFTGHFPGKPVMPGALIADGLAQTSGLLWGFTRKAGKESTGDTPEIFFLAAANLKFINPSFPGDILEMTAIAGNSFGTLFSYNVEASVKRKVTVRGTLTLAMMKGGIEQ